ncbi:uncharacterized protein LOC129940170 [Eupeodes corollae]|uniref:uncharacterized protein LOC129940170 n=1 Tax=Eupeodes corollae TaxID=290404 RepID=UPI002491C970|nr:uncharacterized protein LOC129940170 [Eupeodes corollae]
MGRSELEDLYVATKTKILSLLGERRRLSIGGEHSFIMPAPTPPSRLQPLRLPKFNGKYSEYKNFMRSFEYLVHESPALSVIEKYNHLLSCLSGKALDTVNALQVTEENYSKAMQSLKDRFDNNALIFSENISSIFEFPKITKVSPTNLRSLVDNMSALYNSLTSLGSEKDICNAVLIHIVMSKVDSETRNKWDEELDYNKLPSWDQCTKMLNKRCQFLEAKEGRQIQSETNQKGQSKHRQQNGNQHKQTSLAITQRTQKACAFCNDDTHYIASCQSFKNLSVIERFSNAKRLELCINCLGRGHTVSTCSSKYTCRICRKPHHFLLHRTQTVTNTVKDEVAKNPLKDEAASTSAAVHAALEEHRKSSHQVILATAVVLVKDSTGSYQFGRVLLDSGSQVNMVSEKFAKSLFLRKNKKFVDITGISGSKTNIQYQTQTTIRSRFNNFEISLEFLIAHSITGYQPDEAFQTRNWNIPNNIELADVNFNRPSKIDMLLGAEAFFDLLSVGQIKLGKHLPILQKTLLGWIVSGKYSSSFDSSTKTCCLSTEEISLNQYVEKFWELEEVNGRKSKWTEEQIQCEEEFNKTIEEIDTGRLMVKLPFKKNPECLGASYDIAFRRFLSLERRLLKNLELKADYSKFLKEYEDLGHMSKVKSPNLEVPHYYLPHQCVLKPDSVSTKLRVVFDASCCTSSQISLNKILMVGPTIQADIFTLLLRFRCNRYVLTADISKMYRQVLIHPSHRQFQYILWRESNQKPVETYQLNTVTYGTSSAPFLAIRCLHYLSDKFKDSHSLGSKVLKSDFYVDDMLSGANDLETLQQIREEVSFILSSAGFELTKWHSNVDSMPQATEKVLKLSESGLTSTLGITWNPMEDNLIFSYKPSKNYSKFTKRTILSLSSSLFDPIGLLGPIIIKAKIILQKLWIEKLDWDASIPQNIETEWKQFLVDLNSLQDFSIPRFVLSENKIKLRIHGFSDASLNAYGCCIYASSIDSSNSTTTKLLAAKSKVSPAKKKCLPRLELCGAHLLAKLWSKVKILFEGLNPEVYFWTDSEVVLHWIGTHTSKLQTFVGNRVAEIQEITDIESWRHVPTQDNPADVISRGCTVQELKESNWFSGPKFILKYEEWPPIFNNHSVSKKANLEMHKTVLLVRNQEENHILKALERYSTYTKMVRIVGYMLRFVKVCRVSKIKKRKANNLPLSKEDVKFLDFEEDNLRKILLSVDETQCAEAIIAWNIQQEHFAEEINFLRNRESLKSSMKWLNPFLEECRGVEIAKVGGRLQKAAIPEEQKHPILLPRDAHVVTCFVRDLHLKNYHAGPKALLALIRQKFWIINAREIARRTVRRCIPCVRYRPKLMEQVMGDLPAERITPASRPFQNCGVDFCGPFFTYLKIRGKIPYKTYIAVFVCFSSKAVHLEAVSDLSSEAFLAALKRLIGRRGLPQKIFCDNATNFVGTRSKAPHFGGLWESAVKIAKGHLYRTLENAKLTFEELSTALVEIEAVMNSRPITPMSSDPSDLEALTPGHFLIGSSLRSIPEPIIEVEDISYLQRWRRIQAVKSHFWRRWTSEYLTELQSRSKWTKDQPNLNIGEMVVVHEDNTPPQQWLLGRVIKVIPGKDGCVRVADVRTTKGIIRRPIRKLALLPV